MSFLKIEVDPIMSTVLRQLLTQTIRAARIWNCMHVPLKKMLRSFEWTFCRIVSAVRNLFPILNSEHVTSFLLVMLASVPFLIATFVVYVCLPELRNLHGKCLLGYLLCMAVGYTCLGLVLINGDSYIDPLLCKSAGFTIYFSFLSAFLCSNVIR